MEAVFDENEWDWVSALEEGPDFLLHRGTIWQLPRAASVKDELITRGHRLIIASQSTVLKGIKRR
jgi:hypothetical protein